MQDHLASLRSLIQDKENIIENLILRYEIGIITQDSNRQSGANLGPDEIEMEELRRKAEALAQRTILENFELREMVDELRDVNFHLGNEIYELQDKINRQTVQINKLHKSVQQSAEIATNTTNTMNVYEQEEDESEDMNGIYDVEDSDTDEDDGKDTDNDHKKRPTITDLGDMHIIPHDYLDKLLEEEGAKHTRKESLMKHVQARLEKHLPQPVAATLADTLVTSVQGNDEITEEDADIFDLGDMHRNLVATLAETEVKSTEEDTNDAENVDTKRRSSQLILSETTVAEDGGAKPADKTLNSLVSMVNQLQIE
eukprot:26565_1